MKDRRFGLVRSPWGVFGHKKQNHWPTNKPFKTSDKHEAQRHSLAHNESESQPHFNLSLARVYLNGADPKLATRTWQDNVMEDIVAKKKDQTRHRWETAIKDKNFDCLRRLTMMETLPEHFDRALADGKVSTNVYLRRIHNHALGMEWLLKSVIPRLQWPKPVFKTKRAITAEEHAAINCVEQKQRAPGTFTKCSGILARRNQTEPACERRTSTGKPGQSVFHPQETKITQQSQADAVPVLCGNSDHSEKAANIGAIVSLSLHCTGRRSGDGVQAAVWRAGDFRGVAAQLSVCVGGAGVEMRIPGAVCATSVGSQLQGGASGVCETR